MNLHAKLCHQYSAKLEILNQVGSSYLKDQFLLKSNSSKITIILFLGSLPGEINRGNFRMPSILRVISPQIFTSILY